MLSESTAETRRSIILDEEPAITPHPPPRLLTGILTCLLYPRRHGVAPPLHNGDVNVKRRGLIVREKQMVHKSFGKNHVTKKLSEVASVGGGSL